MSEKEYAKFVFWLNFDNQLIWIILFDLFCIIVSDGYVGIALSIVYICYGKKKQRQARIRSEILKKKFNQDFH